LIYFIIFFLRNKFYDWGWLKIYSVNAPVLSVGNIQIGGTGKTPFTEFLARKLVEMGKKPVILTRGYRRKNSRPVIVGDENRKQLSIELVGDEPFLLAQNLSEVPIGVDANRFNLAQTILRKQPESIFILDDGFQHRGLKRTIDFVLIDVERWTTLPFLFPYSPNRDFPSSLRRAHIIILTRVKANPVKTEILRKQLFDKYNIPVFTANFSYTTLQSLILETHLGVDQLSGKKIAAFCGIADPMQFFLMLKEQGADIVWKQSFPDHHYYTEKEIERINRIAEKLDIDFVITTQKDGVRIQNRIRKNPEKFFFPRMIMELDQKKKFEEIFFNLIHSEPSSDS
jgi:tetraacyldisaccharide 4'-kinase